MGRHKLGHNPTGSMVPVFNYTQNQKEFNSRLLDKGIYIMDTQDFNWGRLATGRCNDTGYLIKYFHTGSIAIFKEISILKLWELWEKE